MIHDCSDSLGASETVRPCSLQCLCVDLSHHPENCCMHGKVFKWCMEWLSEEKCISEYVQVSFTLPLGSLQL